jgi:hypothetical protein
VQAEDASYLNHVNILKTTVYYTLLHCLSFSILQKTAHPISSFLEINNIFFSETLFYSLYYFHQFLCSILYDHPQTVTRKVPECGSGNSAMLITRLHKRQAAELLGNE